MSLSGGTSTYSTPDGQSWTFNPAGYLTQWLSADGQQTLSYRYDGLNRRVSNTISQRMNVEP